MMCRRLVLGGAALISAAACSNVLGYDDVAFEPGPTAGGGGEGATAGSAGEGGLAGTDGGSGTGGEAATGGASGSGGSSGTGGESGTGGVSGSAGSSGTGGTATGGTGGTNTGGTSTGGSSGTGVSGTGGTAGTAGTGGVGGTAGSAGGCPAAFPGASAEQAEALAIINGIRSAGGLPCLTLSAEASAAAQNHAHYGNTNAGDAACRSSGHDETQGCPEYTGASFSQRLSAAGYTGGGSSEIVHFIGNPSGAISGWLGTLWHRIPLVHPNSKDFGSGTRPGWDVMDFGAKQSADKDGVWFYPFDGSTGVSRQGGNESPSPPDPPSGCSTWGTFITVLFEQSASVQIDTHTITGPAGDVDHTWHTGSFLTSKGFAFVPCPLDGATQYTARVTGTLNGAPLDRATTFTTQ